MEYNLTIGGIGFRISCCDTLRIEDSMALFLASRHSDDWDVHIEFSKNFQLAPRLAVPMAGEDLLLRYYWQDQELLCVAKGGWKGPLAISRCDLSLSHLICYMNKDVLVPADHLANLLRLIPMRMILQKHGVSFFHASQIAVNGRGILFTAPSGTGKTTQAKLWRDFRGAPIICNDRTLFRDGLTYGYPMDGSEPVCSGEVYPLGAVVYLTQSNQNTIQRLKPGIALAKLMPQLVFDGWDFNAKSTAMNQLMDLLERYPVYQLDCTADEAAVQCLEECLQKDGVI